MALGMGRTAEVKRDARIGEAEAKSDAQIKEAIAEEQRMASRLANDILIAKAQRDFEVKKAAYDQEVNAKVALSLKEYSRVLKFVFKESRSRIGLRTTSGQSKAAVARRRDANSGRGTHTTDPRPRTGNSPKRKRIRRHRPSASCSREI